MATVIIQIGNSDDKLSQSRWSDYVETARRIIQMQASEIHFFGGSLTWDTWQNVAWVIYITEEDAFNLKNELFLIRKKFGQDSVAWTIGDTEFI